MSENLKCVSCQFRDDCLEHGITPEQCEAIFNEGKELRERCFIDSFDDIQCEEYYDDGTRSSLVL